MNKHTISAEELLKAYNGKYKYVTMNKNGDIYAFQLRPKIDIDTDSWDSADDDYIYTPVGPIAITEFQGKNWTDCIYKAKPSEEDWIGKLCFFGDTPSDLEDESLRTVGILKYITTGSEPYMTVDYTRWSHCRPATRDEIKFFNDNTSEN